MVFYRQYRPQLIDDLIGQDHVKKALLEAVNTGKLAHAYLLAGPKGTGKTSTARILAKMVNCQKQGCSSCQICQSITDGSALDLIEIDAASNRGIDDIRSLRENIKLTPSLFSKKVYIIDEVHMLTTEAFNALLKTLEEPPDHVLFILATTEPQKIPPTILSRVVKFDFSKAADVDLEQMLNKVASNEKLKIDRDAVKMLAKKSDGSFRDGLKIFEQLAILLAGKKITADDVEGAVKSGKFEESLALLQLLADKNCPGALEQIAKLSKAAVNFKEYTLSLLDLFRAMMLLKYQATSSVKDELGSDKYQPLLDLTDKFSSGDIIRIINLLVASLEKIRFVTINSLPLEVAVVEACLEGGESVVRGTLRKDATSPAPKDVTTISDELPTANQQGSPDLNKLLDKWTYILETVKPYNFSLEALLRQVQVLSCDDGLVKLEVPYSFHQRILEAPKSRDLLESVLADVLGRPIKVVCVLGTRPVRVEELANVELAADDEIIKIASEIFNSESINEA